MAEQQVRLPAAKRRGTKQYVVLALAVLLVLAAAAAVSYYSEEIRLYLNVGGWNSGTATRITQQFIDHLHAGRTQDALALVDRGNFDPITEHGKTVGLIHRSPSGMGRYRVLFHELIPPGPVQVEAPQLTAADQGGFVVPVRFADRTDGWFVVARLGNAYRIVEVPTVRGRFHY